VARIRDVDDVKYICGVTLSRGVSLEEVTGQLEPVLGRIDSRSEVFDFNFSDYYAEEMGDGLRKIFLSFSGLMSPQKLPEIKHKTNEMEATWSVDGKRRVNLDPGYVTRAKLVLASAKDFAHRILLGDGIYGDVQLQFRQNRFRVQVWTFPDYQTDLALAFFEEVRKTVYRELRQHG